MNVIADILFQCPHCGQQLECSTEHAGLDVNCPVCEGIFTLSESAESPPPESEQQASVPVKHWIVDVRVLVLRAPPIYIKMLVEVPESWSMPRDGSLPGPLFKVITAALRTRFPQSPITPIKVRNASSDLLYRAVDEADYREDACKVWVLGRTTSSL